MANIIDYLVWRGDISFDYRRVNDVDNVILSTLSYLDFTGIVPAPGEGYISLGHACQRVLEDTGGDVNLRVRSLAKLDPSLLNRLAGSKRFGTARMHGYVDVLDESRALQFAVVQIDLTDTETYVSFRGTDSTLVGWREDFMLSFTVTEAQRMAADYLKRAAEEAQREGRTLYVGGHSKGGNLALYAALSLPLALVPTLGKVWSNDGPGIAPQIMPASPKELLGDRYQRIVPETDFIGIIFERSDDPRTVVASSATAVGCHDPFTWQVGPFGMEEVTELSSGSQAVKKALDSWTSKVPLKERGPLVDQLFDALEAGGAKTTDEVAATRQSTMAVLAAIGNMDEENKRLGMSLMTEILQESLDVTTNAVQEGFATALQMATDMTGINFTEASERAASALKSAREAFGHVRDGQADDAASQPDKDEPALEGEVEVDEPAAKGLLAAGEDADDES